MTTYAVGRMDIDRIRMYMLTGNTPEEAQALLTAVRIEYPYAYKYADIYSLTEQPSVFRAINGPDAPIPTEASGA